MTIVNSTSPIDSRMSGALFARRSRTGDSTAAANSSGGRKTSRTRSGSSLIVGQTRDEGQAEAAEDEQGRVRDAEPPGDLVQDRDHDEGREDGSQELHVRSSVFTPSSDSVEHRL